MKDELFEKVYQMLLRVPSLTPKKSPVPQKKIKFYGTNPH